MVNDDKIKKTISRNIAKYRKLAGLNQKEFASRLGAAPSRVSSWETGANSTDIDTLFEICSILNVSINDMCEIYPDSNIILSYDEQIHIKKYRDLDNHGKDMVDTVLDKEWTRSTSKKEDEHSYLKLMAAHNDSALKDGELEKMQSDIDMLDSLPDK